MYGDEGQGNTNTVNLHARLYTLLCFLFVTLGSRRVQEEKSLLDPALPAEDPQRKRLEKEIEQQARIASV